MRTRTAITATALVTLLCACGSDRPAQGPVSITTEIDFTQEPYSGTFEVGEGAEVLGCSNGSFVDTPVADGVEKLFTCEEGDTGTFTAHFQPPEGPWRIVASTDDFSGLDGEGDFAVVEGDTPETGVETLTGDVRFGSEE